MHSINRHSRDYEPSYPSITRYRTSLSSSPYRKAHYLDESDEEIIHEEILDITYLDHYPTLIERWGNDAKPVIKQEGDFKIEDFVEFDEIEPTITEEISYEITYTGDQIKSAKEIHHSCVEKRNFRKLRKRRIRRKRQMPTSTADSIHERATQLLDEMHHLSQRIDSMIKTSNKISKQQNDLTGDDCELLDTDQTNENTIANNIQQSAIIYGDHDQSRIVAVDNEITSSKNDNSLLRSYEKHEVLPYRNQPTAQSDLISATTIDAVDSREAHRLDLQPTNETHISSDDHEINIEIESSINRFSDNEKKIAESPLHKLEKQKRIAELENTSIEVKSSNTEDLHNIKQHSTEPPFDQQSSQISERLLMSHIENVQPLIIESKFSSSKTGVDKQSYSKIESFQSLTKIDEQKKVTVDSHPYADINQQKNVFGAKKMSCAEETQQYSKSNDPKHLPMNDAAGDFFSKQPEQTQDDINIPTSSSIQTVSNKNPPMSSRVELSNEEIEDNTIQLSPNSYMSAATSQADSHKFEPTEINAVANKEIPMSRTDATDESNNHPNSSTILLPIKTTQESSCDIEQTNYSHAFLTSHLQSSKVKTNTVIDSEEMATTSNLLCEVGKQQSDIFSQIKLTTDSNLHALSFNNDNKPTAKQPLIETCSNYLTSGNDPIDSVSMDMHLSSIDHQQNNEFLLPNVSSIPESSVPLLKSNTSQTQTTETNRIESTHSTSESTTVRENNQNNFTFMSIDDEQTDADEARSDLTKMYFELQERRHMQPLAFYEKEDNKSNSKTMNKIDYDSFPTISNLPTREYNRVFGTLNDVINTMSDLTNHVDQTIESALDLQSKLSQEQQPTILTNQASSTDATTPVNERLIDEIDFRYNSLLSQLDMLISPLADVTSPSLTTPYTISSKTESSNHVNITVDNDHQTKMDDREGTSISEQITDVQNQIQNFIENIRQTKSPKDHHDLIQEVEALQSTISNEYVTPVTTTEPFTNDVRNQTITVRTATPSIQTASLQTNPNNNSNNLAATDDDDSFRVVQRRKRVPSSTSSSNTQSSTAIITTSQNISSDIDLEPVIIHGNPSAPVLIPPINSEVVSTTSIKKKHKKKKRDYKEIILFDAPEMLSNESILSLSQTKTVTDIQEHEQPHSTITQDNQGIVDEQKLSTTFTSTHLAITQESQHLNESNVLPMPQTLQILSDPYPWYSSYFLISDAEAKLGNTSQPLHSIDVPVHPYVEVPKPLLKDDKESDDEKHEDDDGFRVVHRRKRVPSSTSNSNAPTAIITNSQSISSDIDLEPVIIHGNPSAPVLIPPINSEVVSTTLTKKKQKKKKRDYEEMILFDAPDFIPNKPELTSQQTSITDAQALSIHTELMSHSITGSTNDLVKIEDPPVSRTLLTQHKQLQDLQRLEPTVTSLPDTNPIYNPNVPLVSTSCQMLFDDYPWYASYFMISDAETKLSLLYKPLQSIGMAASVVTKLPEQYPKHDEEAKNDEGEGAHDGFRVVQRRKRVPSSTSSSNTQSSTAIITTSQNISSDIDLEPVIIHGNPSAPVLIPPINTEDESTTLTKKKHKKKKRDYEEMILFDAPEMPSNESIMSLSQTSTVTDTHKYEQPYSTITQDNQGIVDEQQLSTTLDSTPLATTQESQYLNESNVLPMLQTLQILSDPYPWYSSYFLISDAEAKLGNTSQPLHSIDVPVHPYVEVPKPLLKDDKESDHEKHEDDDGFRVVHRRKRVPSSTSSSNAPTAIITNSQSISSDIDLEPVIIHGNPSAPVLIPPINSEVVSTTSIKKKHKKKKRDYEEMILFDAPEIISNEPKLSSVEYSTILSSGNDLVSSMVSPQNEKDTQSLTPLLLSESIVTCVEDVKVLSEQNTISVSNSTETSSMQHDSQAACVNIDVSKNSVPSLFKASQFVDIKPNVSLSPVIRPENPSTLGTICSNTTEAICVAGTDAKQIETKKETIVPTSTKIRLLEPQASTKKMELADSSKTKKAVISNVKQSSSVTDTMYSKKESKVTPSSSSHKKLDNIGGITSRKNDSTIVAVPELSPISTSASPTEISHTSESRAKTTACQLSSTCTKMVPAQQENDDNEVDNDGFRLVHYNKRILSVPKSMKTPSPLITVPKEIFNFDLHQISSSSDGSPITTLKKKKNKRKKKKDETISSPTIDSDRLEQPTENEEPVAQPDASLVPTAKDSYIESTSIIQPNIHPLTIVSKTSPSSEEDDDDEGFQLVKHRKHNRSTPRSQQSPKSPTKTMTFDEKTLRSHIDTRSTIQHGRFSTGSRSIPRTIAMNEATSSRKKTFPNQTSSFSNLSRSASSDLHHITSATINNNRRTFQQTPNKNEPLKPIHDERVQQHPHVKSNTLPTERTTQKNQNSKKPFNKGTDNPKSFENSFSPTMQPTTKIMKQAAIISNTTSTPIESFTKQDSCVLAVTTCKTIVPELHTNKSNERMELIHSTTVTANSCKPLPADDTHNQAINENNRTLLEQQNTIVNEFTPVSDFKLPPEMHTLIDLSGQTQQHEQVDNLSKAASIEPVHRLLTSSIDVLPKTKQAEQMKIQEKTSSAASAPSNILDSRTTINEKSLKKRKKKSHSKVIIEDTNKINQSNVQKLSEIPKPDFTSSLLTETKINDAPYDDTDSKLNLFLPDYIRQQIDTSSTRQTTADNTHSTLTPTSDINQRKKRSKMLTKDHEAKSLLTNEFDNATDVTKQNNSSTTLIDNKNINTNSRLTVQQSEIHSSQISDSQPTDNILSRGFHVWLHHGQALSQKKDQHSMNRNVTQTMQNLVIKPVQPYDESDDDNSTNSPLKISLRTEKKIHINNAYAINHPTLVLQSSSFTYRSTDDAQKDESDQSEESTNERCARKHFHRTTTQPSNSDSDNRRSMNLSTDDAQLYLGEDFYGHLNSNNNNNNTVNYDDWACFVERRILPSPAESAASKPFQCFYTQILDEDTLISNAVPNNYPVDRDNKPRYGDFSKLANDKCTAESTAKSHLTKSKPSESFQKWKKPEAASAESSSDDEVYVFHSTSGLCRQVMP